MMKIILLSGKAESGKTSAAMMISQELRRQGHRVMRISYGDYIKHTARTIWGWDGAKDEKGRKLLQWWGTDIVRQIRPDFWADTVTRLATVIDEYFDFIIIDDARYINELDCWEGKEAYTIRVDRPGHENALTQEQREHISETSLDNYHFALHLIATNLTELSQQVNAIILPAIGGG